MECQWKSLHRATSGLLYATPHREALTAALAVVEAPLFPPSFEQAFERVRKS